MFYLRKAIERGHTKTHWLDSYHTFSFGGYYHPNFMGFSDLRVINDDIVEPGEGFGTHPHDNMEIVSIVLSGALEHKDSMGNGSIIRPGEIQKMSAGSGITHSEFNPSPNEPVHFLQIWLLPSEEDIKPYYEQKKFAQQEMMNKLKLIVAPEGQDGAISIVQDARIFQSILTPGSKIKYQLNPMRKTYIHVAEGGIKIDSEIMSSGDGLAIAEESELLEIEGLADKSNILIFDLSK